MSELNEIPNKSHEIFFYKSNSRLRHSIWLETQSSQKKTRKSGEKNVIYVLARERGKLYNAFS